MEKSVMMRDPRKSNYYYEESIKTLRTNIQFSSKQVKTILLTSCYPNEGKVMSPFLWQWKWENWGRRSF